MAMISPGDRCPTCGRKHRRSQQANARYWALLHILSERLPVRGEIYSPQAWHAYMKSKFLGCTDLRLPNGKTHVVPNSTAALDTAEFGAYMDRVEAWASEHDVWLDEIMEAA